MWIREYQESYKGVSAQAVWDVLTDIDRWPQWHGDLEFCKLEGDFKAGSFFTLKPKNMGLVKIQLTEINEGHSFTDCTRFWGAKMYDTHTLEEMPEGVVKLKNKLVVTGPLSWIWIFLVARNVAKSVPDEMSALIQVAKRRE
ncbi:MAG: polyketide cyclase [bacterium]|nr:polyketide cyclase [bacterium]